MAEKRDARERRTEDQLLDDIESMEEKLKIYRRRLAKRRAQDGKRERSWRNHALIVIGSMVEAHIIGGWKNIDFDKLDDYLNTYDRALKGKASIKIYKNEEDVAADAPNAAAANSRVRDFEKRQREARAAARARAAEEKKEASAGAETEEVKFADTPDPMF